MDDILQTILNYAEEHWIKFLTAAVFMFVGWILGQRRERRNWEKKEFLDRLNVSLNILKEGKLHIRTLIEKDCEDVFLNDIARKRVLKAAHKTTKDDPILPLPQDEYWHFLNPILNEVSERFAIGMVHRDAGKPVTRVEYVFCLTNECEGEMRTRKIRAMLIRKELLKKLPEEEPKYESPLHKTRWKTLNLMAKAYEQTPWRFQEMEICLAD